MLGFPSLARVALYTLPKEPSPRSSLNSYSLWICELPELNALRGGSLGGGGAGLGWGGPQSEFGGDFCFFLGGPLERDIHGGLRCALAKTICCTR